MSKAMGGISIRGAGCPLSALTGKHRDMCLAMETFVREAVGFVDPRASLAERHANKSRPIRHSLSRRQQAMPGPTPDSSNHCEFSRLIQLRLGKHE